MDTKRFEGHTPGPWAYTGTGNMIGGPDRLRVADCYLMERVTEERVANGYLIAAAPDLLAENERLRAALEQFRNELQVVDSSGEGHPLAWFTLRLKRLAAALAGEDKD